MPTDSMLKQLQGRQIILGSGSPRRRELLTLAGLTFSVMVSDVEESFPDDLHASEVALYIARKKCSHCFANVSDPEAIIITADSIVVCENVILGKPIDLQDAKAILRHLSGKEHQVFTGVVIRDITKIIEINSVTRVYFDHLSDAEIDFYVNNYSVLDRAGAYGIQDWIGLTKVKKIEGSFYNVVGLPVEEVYRALAAW